MCRRRKVGHTMVNRRNVAVLDILASPQYEELLADTGTLQPGRYDDNINVRPPGHIRPSIL